MASCTPGTGRSSWSAAASGVVFHQLGEKPTEQISRLVCLPSPTPCCSRRTRATPVADVDVDVDDTLAVAATRMPTSDVPASRYADETTP